MDSQSEGGEARPPYSYLRERIARPGPASARLGGIGSRVAAFTVLYFLYVASCSLCGSSHFELWWGREAINLVLIEYVNLVL
jgi:hypothetical protein